MLSRTGAGSMVLYDTDRIFLEVGVPAITLFYPQAWLFEPCFPCAGSQGLPCGQPSLPLLQDVKRGAEACLALVGKNCSL